MKPWRKIHAKILDSEQVARLSDAGIVMLCFLITAQDDSGWYSWSPSKVRRLVATRPKWTLSRAKKIADEIVSVGIAEWVDGGILLIKGVEFNGQTRTDVAPMLYSRRDVNGAYTGRERDVGTDVNGAYTGRMSRGREEGEKRERRGEVEERPPPRNIFTLYENLCGTPIPGGLVETLTEAEKLYPTEWFEDAFTIAAEHNARNWAYPKKILERWAREGKDDGRGETGRGVQKHRRHSKRDDDPFEAITTTFNVDDPD